MQNNDDKPTGVFVRLPNDAADPQWAKAYDAVVGDEGTKKAALWDFIQIAKAIGTPVTSGELEPLAFVNADRLKWKIATNNDVCLTFSGKPHLGGGTLNLIDGIVLQSDALAKLAEKDAEIARLQDAMKEAREHARKGSWSRAHVVLHKALKGQEA